MFFRLLDQFRGLVEPLRRFVVGIRIGDEKYELMLDGMPCSPRASTCSAWRRNVSRIAVAMAVPFPCSSASGATHSVTGP